MAAKNALAPSELFGHVQDAPYFHVPRFMSPHGDGHIYLPQPLATVQVGPDGQPILDHHGHQVYEAIWESNTGITLVDQILQPFDLQITKFMVLEAVVAIILAVVFIRLAQRMRGGGRPAGVMWNMLEGMLLYLRDHVARPAIGSHDYQRFLPLIWTIFFFVLGCNLMGILPWMGSPTGALAVTATLAFVTFATVILSGMRKLGPVGFWKAQVPHMDLPKPVAVLLIPMIFVIEIMGLLIKHFVLAVRLLANMIGGHVVLAVLLAFVAVTAGSLILWIGVMPVSVLGATAVSLLELLVAFIQAYIFAFLTALFIGMAVHPH
jgi:F-type H+-transporting ATPase subunit a